MIKRAIAYILMMVMLISSVCVMNTGAVEDSARAKTQAAYGTITVDGKIEEEWDNSPYNKINIIKNTDRNNYNGWFKVMWDEENLYVLAKVYTNHFVDTNQNAWENDSFEYFVDEGMERTKPYTDGDYQIRSDFKGYVTTSANYAPEDVKAVGVKEENAYIVEIASPFVTITPKDGDKIGFDVQPNSAKLLGVSRAMYGWSESSRTGNVSASTELYGTVELLKKANPGVFSEPEWVPERVATYPFKDSLPTCGEITGVTIAVDGAETKNNKVVLIDDYPAIEINHLAKLIGASVKGGNTLYKDSVSVAYTADSRIAQYINTDYHENGDGTGLMLERTPVKIGGGLYVPVSSLMTTFNYMIEFNRFANPPFMEIITDAFTKNEPEVVVYVDDYGAVGDGVHDDKAAVLKAYYAAVISGKSAKVVFGENKTYRVSERNDASAILYVKNVKDFTFDGRGSTIVVDTPNNTLLHAVSCENIQIKNLSWAYKDYVSTQGRVTSVDLSDGSFNAVIDEGYELLPPTEWINAHGNDRKFTQPADESGDYPLFNVPDTFLISEITHVGDREYKVKVTNSYNLTYLKPGMRVPFALNSGNYDVATTTGKTGQTRNAINFRSCKNMLVENVDLYGSPGFAVEGGFCSGLMIIRDLGYLKKEGYITSGNSDGIHIWRSRSKLLVEDCLLEYNMDDHMNTVCEDAVITERSEDNTVLKVDFGLDFMPGDELLIFEPNSKSVLGRAYVKSYDGNWAGGKLVLDRTVEGIMAKTTDKTSNACRVFNINACCKGTVVRNNIFDGSRRFAYICRTPNVMFENNIIKNCGAGIAPSNEYMAGYGNDQWEGPFPSSMTIRNNYFTGDGNTLNHYPIHIYSDTATLGSTPSIDGMLLDSNNIEVGNLSRMISIDSVNDLYMTNNTIKWDGELTSSLMPVTISNSDVEMIDGFVFDCPQKVSAVFTLSGCRFDKEENAKNITLRAGNTSNLYNITNPAD